MFNNCDFSTNGEKFFYSSIKNDIKIIFDVGCRDGHDGNFLDFTGEVHYFDPVSKNIDTLSRKECNNSIAKFNSFGLGEIETSKDFYPLFGSFFNRIVSTGKNDESNKVTLPIRKGKDYMVENDIQHIDFLKIDTEGYELNVLKGFEDFLSKIRIIQFEYGGTFKDNNVTLLGIVEYLREHGFDGFSYLTPTGRQKIEDFRDHYNYCNIVCFNKNYI